MAQFGWVLFFNRPEGFDALPSKEAKIAALSAHIKQCFEQVEPLLVNGLRFASKQEFIGSACVVGPDNECQRLKQQVEEMGIATMIPNTDCIRPAR